MKIESKHGNGWLTGNEAAKALGLSGTKYLKQLPITRYNITISKATSGKYRRSRYHVDDLNAYLESVKETG